MKRICSFVLVTAMILQLYTAFHPVFVQAEEMQDEPVVEVSLNLKPYQDNGIMPLSENGTGCTLEYVISVDGTKCTTISVPVRYTYGIKDANGKEYAKVTEVSTCSVQNHSNTYVIKKADISTKYTTKPAVIVTTCSVRSRKTDKIVA